jgi:hypothetical protein
VQECARKRRKEEPPWRSRTVGDPSYLSDYGGTPRNKWEVKTVVKRAIVMAISVILALAVAAPIASGETAPQHQDVKALVGDWWTWAITEPSPLEGDYIGGQQCEGESVEGVFFLAGMLGGGDATRTCTVPADTALFFPVINNFCTDDEPNYPQCGAVFVGHALANGKPYATLDGEDLKMRRIATGPFTLTVPEDNIFGAPAGPYTAVSDGFWVYLPKGLEPGEYTVQFGGDFGDFFSLNITYKLIVV